MTGDGTVTEHCCHCHVHRTGRECNRQYILQFSQIH